MVKNSRVLDCMSRTERIAIKKEFVHTLIDSMLKRNFNVSQVAKLIDKDYPTVSVWVRGKNFPALESLELLINIFPELKRFEHFAVARKEKHNHLGVPIDDEMRAWLIVKAEENGCTVSELVRGFIYEAMGKASFEAKK